MEIVLPRRYRGPLTSANGGYACGRLAAFVDAEEVEVTLRLPPPLDRPLTVEHEGGRALLLDGDALVAEARPSAVEVDRPAPVSVEDAVAARERHARDWSPDFGECYVCGASGRRPGDTRGTGRRSRAVARCSGRTARDGAEFVWAAVDCPGAYAVGAEGRGDIVLGRMTARIDRVPDVGEEWVVAAWPLGEDGRKLYAGTALFTPDGELLALARQTWIVPQPS